MSVCYEQASAVKELHIILTGTGMLMAKHACDYMMVQSYRAATVTAAPELAF